MTGGMFTKTGGQPKVGGTLLSYLRYFTIYLKYFTLKNPLAALKVRRLGFRPFPHVGTFVTIGKFFDQESHFIHNDISKTKVSRVQSGRE